MSGNSLDKLENRIRSAVQDAKTVRAENARLHDCLKELAAERDVWKQRAGRVGGHGAGQGDPPDPAVVRDRLRAILNRLEQIERQLYTFESR